MAVTLTHTPGAADANSYASVAEADAFFETRLRTTEWAAASADDKARALIMATRDLEAGVDWDEDMTGWRTTTTQALEFPKNAVRTRSGDAFYSSTENPPWLKEAEFEQALAHLRGDRTTDSAARGIRSVKAGVEVVFDGVASQTTKTIADAVWRIIEPWALNGDDSAVGNRMRAVELERV